MNNLPTYDDVSFEMIVVGEMFCNEEAAIYAFECLDPESFATTFASDAFRIARTRFENGLPFDALSCTMDFDAPDEARLVLGRAAQSVINTDNFREHIRILKRESLKREMEQLSVDASNFIYGNPSISEMQTFLSDRLERFSDDGIRNGLNAAEGIDNFIANIGKEREYIKTGIKPIDDKLKISKGDYIILGARPSVGKTAFALQIAWQMGFKHRVVFYSFETSIDKIYDRIVANQFAVNFGSIVRGELSQVQIDDIERGRAKTKENHFKVIEASGMTVSEIQASAVREKAEIVFIDYLGLISVNASQNMSSYETITKISKDLHTMAQKRKIAIFCLSQLSRIGNKEIPDLTNLRDSGQIEQDADAVILMSRDPDAEKDEFENKRLIQIAKNKEGTLGAVEMSFIGKYQRFVPFERRQKD